MRDDILAAYDATPAEYAIGHSAGGQLAVWLAVHRPLRAVVSQAGVLDLARAVELRLSDGIVERVFRPDEIAWASPVELDVDARVLCVHGTADADVPLEISERFAARHRDAELRVIEGAGHMGHLDPADPLWHAAADWLDALAR